MAMTVAAILMDQFGSNSKLCFYYILEAYILSYIHAQQFGALQRKQTGARELLWHPDPFEDLNNKVFLFVYNYLEPDIQKSLG